MAEAYRVGLLLLHQGSARDHEARAELAAALPEGELSEPDGLGVFEATVPAGDREDALQKVWNAIAASGTDDHIVFLEHPELPEHWRPRSGAPGG
jgi:hypothetical protein